MIQSAFVLFTLLNFSITVSFSILLLVFLCGLIIVSVYFYYKKTIPFITSNWRILLAALRGLAIFFILLAIAELTLNISSIFNLKPTSLFLLDRSKSMAHDQKSLELTLDELNRISQSNREEFQFQTFSESIDDLSVPFDDNLKFKGAGTNISSALESVQNIKDDKNIQNIVLITDGIYNRGDKPIHAAEKLNIPIFTIGVGNPKPQKDIIVKDIISNDIMYVENTSPVRVDIVNNGYEGKEVEITLFEEGRQIENKKTNLSGNYNEVSFDYTPKSEGDKRLSAVVRSFSDEASVKNNSFSKYVNVLSNKLKVLLIGSVPSSDLGFIKQSLAVNQDYVVKALVENTSGGFLPNNADRNFLDSADVLFFIGFPGKNSSQNFLSDIKSAVQRKNLPIFYLVSNEMDLSHLQIFNDYLPFELGNPYGDVSQIFIDIREGTAKNEILNIDEANSIGVWNSFPPIFRIDREFRSKPESELLSYFKIQNTRINQPLILTRKLNRHRSIAFIGFGIWRLKLLNAIKTNENEFFDRFINNSVKWLSSRELLKNLKLTMSKKIFDASDKVDITGQLYDESNQPISNANISLEMKRGTQNVLNANLEPIGNGLYQFSLTDLEEGDYSFRGSTEIGGQKFLDEGKFTVTETELEYQNLTMNEDLLKQIAEMTGGKYFPAEESKPFFSNVNRYLRTQTVEKEIKKDQQLWNSAYLLLAVILLLGTEWFFRKRLGLL
ncbi:MAG: VWA domain-containing protein [Bacteroidetes bacterium]|nr:VWA domain-containing protein [Bacteroidota bacterium]